MSNQTVTVNGKAIEISSIAFVMGRFVAYYETPESKGVVMTKTYAGDLLAGMPESNPDELAAKKAVADRWACAAGQDSDSIPAWLTDAWAWQGKIRRLMAAQPIK